MNFCRDCRWRKGLLETAHCRNELMYRSFGVDPVSGRPHGTSFCSIIRREGVSCPQWEKRRRRWWLLGL